MNVRSTRRRFVVGLQVWLAACLFALPLWVQATMVRLNTVLGPVDITLYDEAAPLTVANFLGYARSGAYDNSFIHRSMPGFVIQGGGYTWVDALSTFQKIPAGPPVVNEFSPSRSNLRGTVAMAKLPNQPNSATSEWFVNLANNAANLNLQNGGFTVFGKVTAPGMAVVDGIAARQRVNYLGTPFDTLPVLGLPASGPLLRAHYVMVNSVTVLPAISAQADADRIFTYLEAAYPQFVAPANAASATGAGYYYRYYAATDAYVGMAGDQVYYLVPSLGPEIQHLGSVAEWLAIAAAAGY